MLAYQQIRRRTMRFGHETSIAPQRVGRTFSEADAIGLGEAAQFPETEGRGDTGHLRRGGIAHQQSLTNMIKTPRPSVLRGALAKELQTGQIEGSPRHA